ncbi:MAG TPA: SpoIID/LytB domain-containing protein, partial [Bacteroidota bacterium]
MIASEPLIHVGILERKREVCGKFLGEGKIAGMRIPPGDFSAQVDDGKIVLSIAGAVVARARRLSISGEGFLLRDVVIGISFHWERKEDQTFPGALVLELDENAVTAINVVGLEEYLESVISSEMSAESPLELLKAHAITSRSWIVAVLEKQRRSRNLAWPSRTASTGDTLIRWYGREDHAPFDVCADDHCQRYQGISKIISVGVKKAVEATRGMFLVHNGSVCDARYSKACGGISEKFENVWEDTPVQYLDSVFDAPVQFHPLDGEEAVRAWIDSPAADIYCNTSDGRVLQKVLPSFDRETADFFRWQVRYGASELNELVKKKSGIDFGEIVDLIPVQRGPSGRLVRLKIVGTKRTLTLGKELEIRKWFSPTHLYSSAFVADAERDSVGKPKEWILRGAG